MQLTSWYQFPLPITNWSAESRIMENKIWCVTVTLCGRKYAAELLCESAAKVSLLECDSQETADRISRNCQHVYALANTKIQEISKVRDLNLQLALRGVV